MKSIRRLILIVYIVLLLGIMRICILTIPFRYYARRLKKVYATSSLLSEKVQLGYARLIGRFITKVSRFTPWQSKCLVQALVAKILFRRFKIMNNMFIGVGFDDKGKFIAHTWIDVGGVTVLGGVDNTRFKIMSSFADSF